MLCTQLLGTVLVVAFACIFVYLFGFGISGVFFAVILDEGIRAIINLLKFNRIVAGWQAKKE